MKACGRLSRIPVAFQKLPELFEGGLFQGVNVARAAVCPGGDILDRERFPSLTGDREKRESQVDLRARRTS